MSKNIFQLFGGGEKVAEPPQASPEPEKKPLVPPPVAPEVIAVISAMLEAEFRLRLAAHDSRLTFNSGLAQGWSEWGKTLAGPFQGEVKP